MALRQYTRSDRDHILIEKHSSDIIEDKKENIEKHSLDIIEKQLNKLHCDIFHGEYGKSRRDFRRMYVDLRNPKPNNTVKDLIKFIENEYVKFNDEQKIDQAIKSKLKNIVTIFNITPEILRTAPKKEIEVLIAAESGIENFTDKKDRILAVLLNEQNNDDEKKDDEKKDDEKNAPNKKLSLESYIQAQDVDVWLKKEDKLAHNDLEHELRKNSKYPLTFDRFEKHKAGCIAQYQHKQFNDERLSVDDILALTSFTDFDALQQMFSNAFWKKDNFIYRKEFYYWANKLKHAIHYIGKKGDYISIYKTRIMEIYERKDENNDDKLKELLIEIDSNRGDIKYINNLYKQICYECNVTADPMIDQISASSNVYRGINKLVELNSLHQLANQPTSFSLKHKVANDFAGDNGMTIECTDVIGVDLTKVSFYKNESEFWSYGSTYNIRQIMIKTKVPQEQLQFLRHYLMKFPNNIPRIKIFRFIGSNFEIYDTSDNDLILKDLLLDLISKREDMLTITEYNDFTMIQRLFFELKQYYLFTQPIWNENNIDSIASCNYIQTIYLLGKHIPDTNAYKKFIIEYTKTKKLNGKTIKTKWNAEIFAINVIGFIGEQLLISVFDESIEKYHIDYPHKQQIPKDSIIKHIESQTLNANHECFTNLIPFMDHFPFKKWGIKKGPIKKLFKIFQTKLKNKENELKELYTSILTIDDDLSLIPNSSQTLSEYQWNFDASDYKNRINQIYKDDKLKKVSQDIDKYHDDTKYIHNLYIKICDECKIDPYPIVDIFDKLTDNMELEFREEFFSLYTNLCIDMYPPKTYSIEIEGIKASHKSSRFRIDINKILQLPILKTVTKQNNVKLTYTITLTFSVGNHSYDLKSQPKEIEISEYDVNTLESMLDQFNQEQLNENVFVLQWQHIYHAITQELYNKIAVALMTVVDRNKSGYERIYNENIEYILSKLEKYSKISQKEINYIRYLIKRSLRFKPKLMYDLKNYNNKQQPSNEQQLHVDVYNVHNCFQE